MRRELRDDCTPSGPQLEDASRGELNERLAHWRPRHSKAVGQLRFVETNTGRDDARSDLIFDPVS